MESGGNCAPLVSGENMEVSARGREGWVRATWCHALCLFRCGGPPANTGGFKVLNAKFCPTLILLAWLVRFLSANFGFKLGQCEKNVAYEWL
jgi:hypothetical protein